MGTTIDQHDFFYCTLPEGEYKAEYIYSPNVQALGSSPTVAICGIWEITQTPDGYKYRPASLPSATIDKLEAEILQGVMSEEFQ